MFYFQEDIRVRGQHWELQVLKTAWCDRGGGGREGMAALRSTDLFVMIMCCLEQGTAYVASKFTAKIVAPGLNYWARARFSLLRGSLRRWSAVWEHFYCCLSLILSKSMWRAGAFASTGMLAAHHVFISPISVRWVALPHWTSAQRCQCTFVLKGVHNFAIATFKSR